MTKQNHKTGFLVAAMVFSAIALRVLGKFDILIVPGGIARSLIYIALYIGWGISVSKRIIQVQVRHYLIAVSGLMVFWFVIRSMRYFFNYALMKEINGGKQMKDVWTGSLTKPSEKKFGKHPTQKPEYLLERILRASTQAGYIVLDPFCGSGTTGVEALRNGCNFIGIDNVEEYLKLTQKRLDKEQESLFI